VTVALASDLSERDTAPFTGGNVDSKNIQEQSVESFVEINPSIASGIEDLLTIWRKPAESMAEILRADTLDHLVATSLGAATESLPLYRYLPAEISIKDGNEYDLLNTLVRILEIMRTSNFEIIHAGHIEQGSLHIRFTLRTKSRVTKAEQDQEEKSLLNKFIEAIAKGMGGAIGKALITITLGTLLAQYGHLPDPTQPDPPPTVIGSSEAFRQMVRQENNIPMLDSKRSADK
jgi:hypothetical protein